MKNFTKSIALPFVFILCNYWSIAQECGLPSAQKLLDANNITANILNGGDLFWDRADAVFITTPDSVSPVSSIFNAGFWIGAFPGLSNGTPNLVLAISDYNNETSKDYSAGPLTDDGGITNEDNCNNFDKLWEVRGIEIKNHIADFLDDGVVANKNENIYSYPGHQNPHFEDLNGFLLPNTPQKLAPFYDHNSDGIYNPDDGDYPKPNAVHEDHYPEHMIWGVFNDAGSNHTASQAEAARVEIQLTAWAFLCTDNEILNNTIFTSHRIINRNLQTLDSLKAGLFVDFDLGCFTDDYVGCIPDMNTFYAYNTDPVDGSVGSNCNLGINTYASNPPVQSATFLSHPMSAFLTTAPPANGIPQPNPTFPISYYNLMSGVWPDGTVMTNSGNGYNTTGSETTFLFPDNPNDPNGWSMYNENINAGDYRGLSAVDLGELTHNQTTTIDMAYTVHQDSGLNHVETVDLVYDNIPLLQQMYNDQFQTACNDFYLPVSDLDISKIEIFPNPTSSFIEIKTDEIPSHLAIFDLYGKTVLEKVDGFSESMNISLHNISSGIYFVKIRIDGNDYLKKIIKVD